MGAFDAVIFDMDGTLVDSEPMSGRATTQCILERYDKVVDPVALAHRFRGMQLEDLIAGLTELCGQPVDDEFLLMIEARYHALIDTELRPTNGADECFSRLAESLSLAIASNSPRATLAHYLRAMQWQDTFAMELNVFSAHDVAKGKPEPDIFLLAARKLNVEPSRCIVLEDSAPGVRGALAAGMTVVGFAGNHPEAHDDLQQFSIEMIDDLLHFPKLALA